MSSLRGSPDKLYLYLYIPSSLESDSNFMGLAGISLFEITVALMPLYSSSVISGKLILITLPFNSPFALKILLIISHDFFAIKLISFAS